MKKTLSAILLSFMIAGIVSCNSSEMEKRVSGLERRMAELENNKQISSSQVQPVSSTNAVAEADAEGPFPAFTFEKEEHDFGTIKEGDVVTHTFEFTNTGEAPLIIQNAVATCGCTVPSYSKEPIPVGGSGEIQVKFDSKNKPGTQNKTVTITANTNPKISKLRIKSVVSPNS